MDTPMRDYLNQMDEAKPLVVQLPVERFSASMECKRLLDDVIEISQTYSDEPVFFKIGEYRYKIWPEQLIRILQAFVIKSDLEERLQKIESFLVL